MQFGDEGPRIFVLYREEWVEKGGKIFTRQEMEMEIRVWADAKT